MTPEFILLHHSFTKDSQTVSWGAIRKYHVQELKWAEVGYHFGIELVGEQYEALVGRTLIKIGAHCKESYMNYRSIGICFIGNFDEVPPPESQWNLGVRLVSSLCRVFKIPISKIKGHRDFAEYKSCPGNEFNIIKFAKDVELSLPC